MRIRQAMRYFKSFAVCLEFLLIFPPALADSDGHSRSKIVLWERDNLVPWVVNVYDTHRMSSEERAQLLHKLGFRQFAYFFEFEQYNIQRIDTELEILKRHNINLIALRFPFYADDPAAKATLEVIKRHHVHPQLWISPSYRDRESTWRRALPKGTPIPNSLSEVESLQKDHRNQFDKAFAASVEKYTRETIAVDAKDQEIRIRRETDNIAALAKLAAPYGSKIALYNHGGWSGVMGNQVAVIERLKSRGVTDVGIVYAFNHVLDAYHDDTANFPALWQTIRPYVVAVAVTGICFDDGTVIYPSQGYSELKMMRTIQDSGWRGPVALFAAHSGAPDETLGNILKGVDWLSAELKRTGSGGARPFPVEHGVAR